MTTKTKQQTTTKKAKVVLAERTLLKAARELAEHPIQLSGDKVVSRLPLHWWLMTPQQKYYPMQVLEDKFGLTTEDIARAVQKIKRDNTACIDSENIDVRKDDFIHRLKVNTERVKESMNNKVEFRLFVRDKKAQNPDKGKKSGVQGITSIDDISWI